MSQSGIVSGLAIVSGLVPGLGDPVVVLVSGFLLKRGSVAPRHAILAGNTPTFLPRLAHVQILRRTLPRGEMPSGLIGRKRRLS